MPTQVHKTLIELGAETRQERRRNKTNRKAVLTGGWGEHNEDKEQKREQEEGN